MWDKVAWLFLWVTLAFWVGCAGEDTFTLTDEPEMPQAGAEAVAAESEAVEPSADLRWVDRSDWSRIVIAPERGRVAHYPVYYTATGDVRIAEDRQSVLREDGDVAQQAEAAMTADAHLYRQGGGLDAVIAPFVFGFETAILPVKMVRTPPWQVQYTPDLE
ncbi:MAG: hypothetical protein WD294_09555 [Phycisphaeraceae bacterium]